MQGGQRQPKIITYHVDLKVLVRKYPVDTKKLQKVLRQAKKDVNITNREISEKLSCPVTMVEHWFRTDNSFSIPAPDIWPDLKQLLNIKTDEFDDPIMIFEEKDGVYEKSNRIYDEEGLAPTLTSATPNEKILITEEISPNELLFLGGLKTGKMWLEDGKKYSRNYKQGNRIYSAEGIACSQTANGGGLGGATGLYLVYERYEKDDSIYAEVYQVRIRRLTPLECLLLMGFDKKDYKKLRAHGFSDTRLYKMAGNSIVVNVLEHIFQNLLLAENKNKVETEEMNR